MAFQRHNVRMTVELDGVDITEYLPQRVSFSIEKNRDFPNFGVFNASGIALPLLNRTGVFDTGRSPNFFTQRGRGADGHGTRLLMTITRDTTEQLRIVGEVVMVESTLNSSLVSLVVRDISLRLRRSAIEGFGQVVSRRITDYPNADSDFEVSQYHFRFPTGLTPILRGSVTASILVNDVSQPITIVEAFSSSGTFSYQRATVDYENSVLQLEASPPDGNRAVIDASWRIAHRYKRPDFLVRMVMGDVLFQNLPTYAVESIIFEDSEETFSSNGRPFYEENGVVRWLMRNASDKSIWMAHQNALVKYDETLDTYTKVATTPDDTSITAIPTGGYGEQARLSGVRLPGQRYTTPIVYWTSLRKVQVIGSQVYATETTMFTTREIYYSPGGFYSYSTIAPSITLSLFSTDSVGVRSDTKYFLSGNILASRERQIGYRYEPWERGETSYRRRRIDVRAFDIYNNELYALELVYTRKTPVSDQRDAYDVTSRLQKYQFSELSAVETTATRNAELGTTIPNVSSQSYTDINITPSRIIVLNRYSVEFYTHAGVRQDSERFVFGSVPGTSTPIEHDAMAVGPQYIYLLNNNDRLIYVYTHAGVRQPLFDIRTMVDYKDITVSGETLYALRGGSMYEPEDPYNPTFVSTRRNAEENSHLDAFSLVNTSNYHGFSIFQFDTTDFNTFYCLTSNTAKGDITQDPNFNENRISRYVRTTDTWTTLTDRSLLGFPQVAEPFDGVAQNTLRADNRKGFKVVRYNNEDYIFFRRVTSTHSQLAFYNTSNSLVGTVQSYSTTTSTTQGRQWATDFVMETRSDNTVWSYFFMVNYNLSGGTYGGGHLQVIARRIFPFFSASSRFLIENFAGSLTTYPTSVSGLAVANDKLYFVLDYQAEGTTTPGKAELCVMPKSSGARTVLKTYTDPLLAARSPCVVGTSVYYLEGGTVRRQGAEDVEDLYYYPDMGGHLIEVKADNSIDDHGVVWRTGNVLDSPDPETPDRRYDGWGLHNSIPSNMIEGAGGTLNFIAGVGNPFRTDENLPSTNPVILDGDLGNFVWVQYGKLLSMKIEQADLEGRDYWSACTQMAILTDADVGFSPRTQQVTDFLTANPMANTWEAWATMFFRLRAAQRGTLTSALTASATVSTLTIAGADLTVFPATGGLVIIGRELFRYTSAVTAGTGLTLSGVTRSADDSVAGAHAIGDRVYYVAELVRDSNTSLVTVGTRRVDVTTLYNTVVIGYDGGEVRKVDTASRTQFGEIALSLSMPFLDASSLTWLEILADRYLARFKSFRNLVDVNVPFNPTLELANVVVLKTTRGFVSDYETFEIMRIAHGLGGFQTSLVLRGLS